MRVLGLDAAGRACGVALLEDGRLLAAAQESMERGQDSRMIPLVLETLQQAGMDFDALDRFVVTRGPGSFTGIRIALAAAQGLGLATGKPVLGVDRFRLFESAAPPGKPLLIALDSRRAEWFCRIVRPGTPGEPPQLLTPEGMAARLERAPSLTVLSDQPDALRASLPAGTSLAALEEPEAVLAARLAQTLTPGDPETLPLPLYLRAPDVTFPKAPRGTGS